MTTSSGLSVLVAPDVDELIADAVRKGGGQVVDDVAKARALIWTGSKGAGIRDYLSPSIEWVQLPAAGVERWVQDGVVDARRIWTSATGAYAPQIAEHALALLLTCAHELPAHIQARTWTKVAYRPLRDTVVTVLGAGGIGAALVELLAPLGVTPIAINRSGRFVEGAHETYSVADLDAVLCRTDHVVLALPSTSETAGILDRHRLRLLRPHSVIVNVGRGGALDLDDLQVALDEGWIGYAALDVTDPEPLPDNHPLWGHPCAVITSHSANPPSSLTASLSERVRTNVERFVQGRPLLGTIDLHRGY
jgi:phosphoglycerate dehydrogenase-like enzyme